VQAVDFLRAIAAEPDADAPRLVFADWLEEHGEAERAELIRLQVERARLEEGDARQAPLARREQELLAARGDDWLAELPEGMRSWTLREWPFRRGLPAVVTATLEAFQAHGGELLDTFPVERLRLTGLAGRPPCTGRFSRST
jgi:uncharacterized protein (TIGR02996 family)